MIRLTLQTPRNHDNITMHNGSLKEPLIDYRFSIDFNTLRELHTWGVRCEATLPDILTLVGPYAKLWIGSCQGTIAPMDVAPQGWTYPNRDYPVPDSLFWLWYPDELSQDKLKTELNSVSEPDGLLGKYTSIFKYLVPFQMVMRQGETKQIEAIPLRRLPGMVQPDVTWTFETEKLNVLPRKMGNDEM